MGNKICLIYNYAQHYRLSIFQLMSHDLKVDFYFGDKMKDVKKLDYSKLDGFKNEVKNIKLIGPFYWQIGVLRLLFSNYKHYILLGDYFCLSTWFFLFFSCFSNKKTYLWTHGWYGKENFIMKIYKKFFFFLADDILLYGNRAKNLMIEVGIPKNKLSVIYNSLDYDTQLKYRKSSVKNDFYNDYFQNNNKTLVFIGRLTIVKKLDFLIKALDRIRNNGLQLNLAIIGRGECEKALKALTKDYALSNNICFIGSIYEEHDIANFITNADLCVSPGNVGLTAMHCLTYGTPVITNNNFNTQMPEFEAIEIGVTGDFFEEDNLDDLVNIIQKWFLFSINRDLVRKNCYLKIDDFYNPYFQLKIIKDVIKKNS